MLIQKENAFIMKKNCINVNYTSKFLKKKKLILKAYPTRKLNKLNIQTIQSTRNQVPQEEIPTPFPPPATTQTLVYAPAVRDVVNILVALLQNIVICGARQFVSHRAKRFSHHALNFKQTFV